MMGPMPADLTEALGQRFAVARYWEAPDKAAFLADHANTRFMVTDGHTGCSARIMDALPGLELIASYGVGTDAIDLPAAKARGVAVTNTPNVLNDAVAELALGLMLALGRRIVEADRFVRDGCWRAGNFALTSELAGATVGILGLGRIGKEIASRAQAFRMNVVYHGRRPQKDVPFRYYDDLTEMARDVEWLVAAVPGGVQTAGLVDRAVLEALGPQGAIVNVGRGSLIDEAALVELLQAGKLGGAALDVFAAEPDVPDALRAMDNVVLSPHQASATEKTRRAMAYLVFQNLVAGQAGEPLLTPVG